MIKKLSLATLGLALGCTSVVWAGSLGNGAAQRNGQYVFCYAGNPNVVYFTQVMTVAPTASAPNLGVTYGDYVSKTYGLPSIDRERCVRAATSSDAANEKQRYIESLGTTKIVELQWTAPAAQ